MKVCIISPNFLEPTAWMVSAYKTAKLLRSSGFDVVVLTTRTIGSKEYEEVQGIRIHRMKSIFISDPFNFTIPLGLRKSVDMIIREEKPDVFIINKYMFYTSLAGPYLKKKKKRVIVQTDTFPGIMWFAPSKILNMGMWIYSRTIGKRVLMKADKVILLHEGLEETARKLGLKYEVVHNIVEFGKFSKAKAAQDIRNLKKDRTLVTYVGRLDKVKGYELILKAAEEIGKKRKDILFLMVVGDKHAGERRRINKKYKNVRVLGFRKDIEKIWAASDIGLLSSHAEGLPNTVLEAMATGTPVVSSRVGGVPYIITHGKNGLLFERGDVQSMIRYIEMLAGNIALRKKLGKEAKEKIKREFSPAAVSEKWKRIIKDIMNQGE